MGVWDLISRISDAVGHGLESEVRVDGEVHGELIVKQQWSSIVEQWQS